MWWWASLLVKLFLAAVIPLAADENYYWVWSQNLQLSYFDHPAFIAWLLKLGEPLSIFGSAVRWPGVILGHLTVLVWIQTLKAWCDEERVFIWVLLALFSPLVGFGSLVMTPDLPVMFFWSLAFFFFQQHLKSPSLRNSLGLGLSLGLGFCAKYHIVLFVPAALLFLTFERKWRCFPARSILTVVLFGFFGSLPVLIWNYQNQFASFLFQLNHGLGRPEWDPFWTYSYPIGQALLIFPIPLWFAIKAFKKREFALFHYFAWTPLVFFFFSSFRGVVEMNWPIVAYPAVYALCALQIPNLRAIRTTCIIWVGLAILVASQAVSPWIPNAPDKFSEATYFQPTLAAVGKYSPLYAESYQMASYLWFKTKTPTYKLYQMSRRDFYDELKPSKPQGFPFYVVMDKNAGFPEWYYKQDLSAEIVEELSPIFVVRKVTNPSNDAKPDL